MAKLAFQQIDADLQEALRRIQGSKLPIQFLRRVNSVQHLFVLLVRSLGCQMNFSMSDLSNTLEHQTQASVMRICDLWGKRSFSVLLGTEDEVHYLAHQCANFRT